MRLLQVEELSKYFGGLAAVAEVDLHVDQGEIVGLIGPNGAGKTTLFNLLSGALVPSAGRIIFKGEKVNGLKPNYICRKGMARTFQSVKIFTEMTVFQNVLLGSLFGSPGGKSMKEATGEAEKILDFVGLAQSSAILAGGLTLADQKRLEVARALATKPELVLLDEMMAGLNHTEVAESMELAIRIREKGITVFMIEHVMKAIMNICERVIVLDHGKIIAEGAPEEIAASKTVIDVYLGE